MKLEDRDFIRIRDYMYKQYGLNLAAKRDLIESRLSTLLPQKGFASFSAYIDSLMADKSGEEASFLVSRLTTNFTYFMREEAHYHYLTDKALPFWIPQIRDNDLRVWSAACSSGEEPYSIAMTLDDYWLKNRLPKWEKTLLATDISERVMDMARKGVYSADRMQNIPPAWKQRYFKPAGGDNFQISEAMRSQVLIRPFNLMTPQFTFKRRFHVIFCRNVMIYFDQPTKQQLIKRFYDSLEPGGFLMIGLSESLMNLDAGFKYVQPSVYQK